MAKGVLVDTSFLITLADSTRPNHSIALEYWRYFKQHGVVIYLSVIVVSEFSVKQEIPDEIRRACVPLLFNWDDATRSAKFHTVIKRDSGTERGYLKDDLKIIAQAAGILDLQFVITEDAETLASYSQRLYELGKVTFKTVLLKDGFHLQSGHQGQFFDNPTG
jgi:hypothetical protein